MEIDYNPMNDILFKFIFGAEERKNITINFLNAVMNKNIREIEFHNVELNPQHETEKLSRIDIFAILDNKERVNIEVQCVNQYNMAKRTLFYWAHMFLHNNALKSGYKYQELKPAITINVLGYKFLPNKKAHSMYTLYDLENQHRLTDAIELHFLEVPKFEKKSVGKMSKIEKWMAFLSKKLNREEMEELAMTEPAIQDALSAADVFFADDKKYWEYLNRQAAILDYNSGIEGAREEGIKIGVDKGRVEEKISVAKNLLSMGIEIEKISKATNLSVEKIQELAK